MKVDQQLIDDLVSGQLAGDRYRAALNAIDAQPEKWRECALAFLEEQALRQELSLLAKGNALWTTRAAGGASSEEFGDARLNQPLHVQTTVRDSLDQQKRWSGWGRGVLSTAALLLVGVSMGWAVSEMAVDGAGTNPNFASNAANAIPTPSHPLESQLVMDRYMELDHRIPAQLLELQRLGKIRLESIDGIVPVTLDDGTPAIVPVQQFTVMPISQSF
jgi:hypothetical protein